jgi:hypothetical protein
MNRNFYSPPGTGVYMSLLLRPKVPAADSPLITLAAAVSVAEAVEAVSGSRAQIKWVNDIVMNGGKVCGILTEAALDLESGSLDYAVLGIGVNAKTPDDGFPKELQGVAGAVFGRGEAPPDARSRIREARARPCRVDQAQREGRPKGRRSRGLRERRRRARVKLFTRRRAGSSRERELSDVSRPACFLNYPKRGSRFLLLDISFSLRQSTRRDYRVHCGAGLERDVRWPCSSQGGLPISS